MACPRELRGLGTRSPPEREDGREEPPGESERKDRRAQAQGRRQGVQGWTQGRRPNTDTALPQFPHLLNGENGVIRPQSRRLEARERSLLLARGGGRCRSSPARAGATGTAAGRAGGAALTTPRAGGAALGRRGSGQPWPPREPEVRGPAEGARPGCARPRWGGTGGLGRCPATCSGTCECAPMGAAAPLALPLPPPPTAPRS